MRTLKILILSLSLGVLGLVTTVFGNVTVSTSPPVYNTMMPNAPMMPNAQACPQYQTLTPDQKTQVNSIMQNMHNSCDLLTLQIKVKHGELNKLFAQPTLDENAIRNVSSEIAHLHDQIYAAHIKARIETAKMGFSLHDCEKAMHMMATFPMGDEESK